MQLDPVIDAVLLALEPLVGRVKALEARVADPAAGAAVAELTKDVGLLRERLAAVEVKPLIPGPAGRDGAPGQAGADGLGYDELGVERRGDRELVVVASRDGRTKEIGRLAFAWPAYRGVYAPGAAYAPGDLVTWGGSVWHCDHATTSRPETPTGAAAWTLAIKRGRDGRDRRDP
jgi:hypothetical protein